MQDDGENGGPALRCGELSARVTALDPGDAEAALGGADDAGDLDGNLRVADLGEGIVHPRVVVQRQRTLIGREVVSMQPVLAQHDGIGGDLAHILDEARQVVGNLWVSRPIVGGRWRDSLCGAEPIHFDYIGRDRPLCGLPGQRRTEPGGK